MLNKTLKRFYKQASVGEVEGGFGVLLDGRPVKTPAGKRLAAPSRALAEAMVAEWQEQGEEIHPRTMPMTQLASTALDRVGPERDTILEQLAQFAGTDLLCYRADFPPDLVARETERWQPLLDWAVEALGARLIVTSGIVAVEQPEAAVAPLLARLGSYDVWRLTAAQSACAASGSLVLALALAEGRLTGQQTYELSQLDETYQIEKWGEDWEAADRRAALQRDILAAERLLTLV
ncbi:MAG TPA: ATP12 family protein [Magnetospirillum sp.]|jgi:chaperone required for assembly of F1-ATPase|nr:ATP12 family protein [Magnetospirillum sp.]